MKKFLFVSMLMMLVSMMMACLSPNSPGPAIDPDPILTIDPVQPIDLVPRVGNLTAVSYNCHNSSTELWTEVHLRNDSNKVVSRVIGYVLFRSKTMQEIRVEFDVRYLIVPRAQNVTGPVLYRVSVPIPAHWSGLARDGCRKAGLDVVQYQN